VENGNMSTATAAATETVRIEGLRVDYEREGARVQALSNVTLSVREREFLAVVGPSGCGKSTLLNVLVGTLRPTAGTVTIDGKQVMGISRSVGYVTQDDNLLPWRGLLSNVELPLELRGVPVVERRRRARELLERVNLDSFEAHFPHELSGGMRQRANIIRALIYDPSIIVMDEPFGSLDAFTRSKMQKFVLDLWESTRKTIMFITHDLAEAVVLADRIVVMSRRPGYIKAIVDIEIPRPRDTFALKTTDAFHQHFNAVWELLAEEVVD
jgi:NitT/TauT family transport system ATP-binding protein